jgi:hypothetical protein
MSLFGRLLRFGWDKSAAIEWERLKLNVRLVILALEFPFGHFNAL